MTARRFASCVLVVEGTKLVGIFTEYDIVKLTDQDIDLTGIGVAEVMTRQLVTVTLLQNQNRKLEQQVEEQTTQL